MRRLGAGWFATLPFCGIAAGQTLHQMRMRLGRAVTLLSALLLLFAHRASGQANLEIRFQLDTNVVESRVTGGTLTVFEHFGNGDEVTESARVSDLDLEVVTTGELGSEAGRFFAQFFCKRQEKCVSQVEDNIMIACNALSQCTDFVNALKEQQAPKRANLENRITQPQPRSVQPPAVQTPPRSIPQVTSQTLAATDLHNLLASIGWLSSGSGTGSGKSALDDLMGSIKPSQSPKPRPPAQSQRSTYAAFSQAAGFDANGAWGVGTGNDLNSAIGLASSNCSQRATTCGDAGYCLLRPGQWGAWASDLKVAGNSAFTCNVATEEGAREQAQAWCGAGCKVLWSGAGQ